eukprot:CAMPEP_0204359280 /NCGR_PEP_ID=MMETSP0469-20131031/37144_1 /ASSEMBLY_ACC=CAM_ASM_000384 /TAXON_ID=2969 /ORGANISM="Oxyrrhis marina" /LENGTH=362 /DNA_ID=CAMNT_0051347289 /DNA_START=9 /DNA_END=1097 /DNA_ORIENTATION=+
MRSAVAAVLLCGAAALHCESDADCGFQQCVGDSHHGGTPTSHGDGNRCCTPGSRGTLWNKEMERWTCLGGSDGFIRPLSQWTALSGRYCNTDEAVAYPEVTALSDCLNWCESRPECPGATWYATPYNGAQCVPVASGRCMDDVSHGVATVYLKVDDRTSLGEDVRIVGVNVTCHDASDQALASSGQVLSTEQCLQACRDDATCTFVSVGNQHTEGACLMQDGLCNELTESSSDVYWVVKLRHDWGAATDKATIVASDQDCDDAIDVFLGQVEEPYVQNCANACSSTEGCSYFTVGVPEEDGSTSGVEGVCYQQKGACVEMRASARMMVYRMHYAGSAISERLGSSGAAATSLAALFALQLLR